MATLGELSVLISATLEEAGFRRGEAALGSIGAAAGKAANEATTALQQIGDAAQVASGRYIDAAGRMREANGRFVSAATLAAEAAGTVGTGVGGLEAKAASLESGLGSLLSATKAVGIGLAVTLGTAIVSLGTEAIKAAGDIQALEKGFAATYNGALPLADALAKVKELAKLPGLGLKEALQGATNLQAAGFSADLATRALGAFGNALATVGKGKADLDGVGLALGQIASKGKISAEEINQLAERVPQIRTAIKDAFGTADTTALQKANISATAFVEGITEQLEKLPKVSGGINNAFENLADASTIALAKLGTSLNNAFNIEGIVNRFSDVLGSVGDAFAELEPEFKAVADFIEGRWNELAQYFGPGGEGGRVMSDLAASIQRAGAAISAVFDELSASGTGSLGELIAAAKPLQNLVREIGDGFTGLLDTVSGTINFITDLLNGRFNKALGDLGVLADGLTRPIRSLLGLVEARGVSIAEFFGVDLTKSLEDASVAGALLGGNIEGSVEAVATLTDAQRDALAKLRAELRQNENLSRALGLSYDYVGERIKILTGGVGDLVKVGFAPLGRTVQGFRSELAGLATAVDQLAPRVEAGVAKLFKTPDFKLKLPEKIAPPEVLPLDLTALDLSAEGLGEIYDKANKRVTQAQIDATNAATSFNTGLEQVLLQGLNNLAVGVGKAIGDIISNASGIEALPAIILSTMGSIAIQLGELAIGVGIATIGIKAALTSLNPALAIAGGIALVALGTAVSNAASGIAKGGKSSPSLASQPGGNYNSPASTKSQPIQIIAEFKLRGQDLVAVVKGQDYRVQRTG